MHARACVCVCTHTRTPSFMCLSICLWLCLCVQKHMCFRHCDLHVCLLWPALHELRLEPTPHSTPDWELSAHTNQLNHPRVLVSLTGTSIKTSGGKEAGSCCTISNQLATVPYPLLYSLYGIRMLGLLHMGLSSARHNLVMLTQVP